MNKPIRLQDVIPLEYLDLVHGDVPDSDLRKIVALLLAREGLEAVKWVNENTGPDGEIELRPCS